MIKLLGCVGRIQIPIDQILLPIWFNICIHITYENVQPEVCTRSIACSMLFLFHKLFNCCLIPVVDLRLGLEISVLPNRCLFYPEIQVKGRKKRKTKPKIGRQDAV